MITITLEVTAKQLLQIAKVLNTSAESISEPSGPNLCSEESLPTKAIKTPSTSSEKPKVKPAPKSKVTMPSFGRTQEQIDQHITKEANRLKELSEEEELKQQRREEREAIKAEKEAEEAKQKQEIDDIKDAVTTEVTKPKMPVKPWAL